MLQFCIKVIILSTLLFPSLAFSQTWDIAFSSKVLGTSTQNNSRGAFGFSNITIDVHHSIWSFSLNYDSFSFYDEAAVVASKYEPPIVNKVLGNRYHLKYVGFLAIFLFFFGNI